MEKIGNNERIAASTVVGKVIEKQDEVIDRLMLLEEKHRGHISEIARLKERVTNLDRHKASYERVEELIKEVKDASTDMLGKINEVIDRVLHLDGRINGLDQSKASVVRMSEHVNNVTNWIKANDIAVNKRIDEAHERIRVKSVGLSRGNEVMHELIELRKRETATANRDIQRLKTRMAKFDDRVNRVSNDGLKAKERIENIEKWHPLVVADTWKRGADEMQKVAKMVGSDHMEPICKEGEEKILEAIKDFSSCVVRHIDEKDVHLPTTSKSKSCDVDGRRLDCFTASRKANHITRTCQCGANMRINLIDEESNENE